MSLFHIHLLLQVRTFMCCRNILYTMNSEKPKSNCPVERVIEVLGGKWKIVILFHLMDGTKRFNELRRLMPDVTQRMLTRQLRELEEYDIVNRKVYAQVPPKVEYSLTDLGRSLDSILNDLHKWGVDNIHMTEQSVKKSTHHYSSLKKTNR